MSLAGALQTARIARLIGAASATLLFAACSSFGYFVANVPVPFGSFQRLTDLAYGEKARQRLDVYSPRAADRPIVVFFYGGSWSMGQRSQYAFVGAALAAHGYVTVIPDYRLYPEVRFPEFMQDGAQAVAWTQQHAREFGGDPDRIVLMGHSAGAHLAALLALNDAYLESAHVRPGTIVGLIGMSGPYALEPNTDKLRTIFALPYTPDDWQAVHFASSRAPPTLLLHGLEDNVVFPSHTQRMRDALESHGARVETHLYANRSHADTIASFALVARLRTPALQQTLDFLQRICIRDERARNPQPLHPGAAGQAVRGR